MVSLAGTQASMSLLGKIRQIRWGMVAILISIVAIGIATLYSAGNGSFDPWASRQLIRFSGGLVLMIAVACVDIRVWLRYAYVVYGISLVLLVWVDINGLTGMGAQRWVAVGPVSLQPSEVMKVAIILVLARYFHGLQAEDAGKLVPLLWPLVLVILPVLLVLKQPDLGTAIMLLLAAGAVFFLAGVRVWMFAVAILGVGGLLPLAWGHLKDYQRNRLLTFINPDNDPLGAGYHILQSKIALGSGGLFGRGFLEGTQSHLNFLPEKQTDFIFTMLAEEWGLVGGLVLLTLYLVLVAYGYAIGIRSRSQFGRILAMGLTTMFFLYIFINVAMVMGLVPVVGVPLPLISYGGTAMLSIQIAFGIILGCYVHRDVVIGRRGGFD
ncbi:MAG TPA: rod shape-determining protein RodA [Alphaproteobacteria bacterium]|jgi:rod shape determining protein RodA|nr:rod shape-determining protein RodA [Alphaproteobacteria bacterium]